MMKTNNIVTIAIATGLLDAGCKYTTNVPGSRSQEIFTALGGTQISINEKVGFEMIYGASLAGKRSVATMKNVGMSTCIDQFSHAVLNGINAGIVLILSDDTEVTSSPEKQDSRPLRDIFEGVWLEPNTVEQAYDMSYRALSLSEEIDMPVVIRITNQLFRQTGNFTRKEKQINQLGISNHRSKYISYWKTRDQAHKNKLIKAKSILIDEFYKPLPKKQHDQGVIMFGSCNEELEEIRDQKFDLLNIVSYPLPEEIIIKFAHEHPNLTILEQGNQYGKEKIKRLLIDKKFKIKSNTGNVPDNSKEWPIFNNQEKLFSALKKSQPSFVVGDEGQFTDESTKTIQVCLCMGSSVGITAGMALNGVSYPFAVTGDTSFLHSNIESLREAVHRNLKFGVIVIDNGGAQTTGGQKNAGDIYDLPQGISKEVVAYEQTSEIEFLDILAKMKKNNSLSILFVTQGK